MSIKSQDVSFIPLYFLCPVYTSIYQRKHMTLSFWEPAYISTLSGFQ